MTLPLDLVVPADSFLERAFLRWVLTPLCESGIVEHVAPQYDVTVDGRCYRVDYVLRGSTALVAVELDGYEFHSDRGAFTYDRLRQNDLTAAGLKILRFSYDAIRTRTRFCADQLAAVLRADPTLAPCVRGVYDIAAPDMPSDPAYAQSKATADAPEQMPADASYFDKIRTRLDLRVLRDCQREALAALANYYGLGGRNAACVMSVGAGKTALGVAAALSFTGRRALVVTPGSVIRGTFDRALDQTNSRSVLYNLPSGPLLPGSKPPAVRVLDAASGAISDVTRAQILAADIVVTNFHSLGNDTGLLSKLKPGDLDFIVIDEAHIAAADSYQRLFQHFHDARTLLMSACFQRLDGKPIDADVVYRYRLIDSIADGNAKNLRIHRFAPDTAATAYELRHPDGSREQIVGKDALIAALNDDKRIAAITAVSDEPIRQVMRVVKGCLEQARVALHPIKPRALFAALGRAHADQIARIANEHGIASGVLHHSMGAAQIKSVKDRFESDGGDLDAIVQLRMLGQGYDFPPISIVVPMRPYGSFGEFYQFIGRGIRVIQHPALLGRVTAEQQLLDVVLHTELGLDGHLATVFAENDMDPAAITTHQVDPVLDTNADNGLPAGQDAPGGAADRVDAFVLLERGVDAHDVLYDDAKLDARRAERVREAMAFRYAEYAASRPDPVSFEQFCEVVGKFSG